jgi:hypothetical protein
MKTSEVEVKFWKNEQERTMIKQLSPTEIYLVQIAGRDLNAPFHHRHERVTYPNADRLTKDLESFSPGSAEDWEDFINEFLQVNKAKLEFMNVRRQKLYEAGKLR